MVLPHGEVVLDGCNASGSAGAHAVTLPHGRHTRARRMAVVETCRVPALGRQGGFDHGAGHPRLFLDDAKAPNCRKNNGFGDLGNYSEWPKVAGAVIQAAKGIMNSCA